MVMDKMDMFLEIIIYLNLYWRNTRNTMKEFFMKTTRLGFSVWEENDIADALKLWGNPEVTKFITANGKMSEEDLQQRLRKEIETHNSFKVQYWPIYLIETNENVGCCGLRPYDLENNILEMGIHLKEEYWGKGLAKEACDQVIKYAFKVFGADALFAGHNPKNTASAKLLKKLGYKYISDEFYPPTGLNHPSYLMTKQENSDRKTN
jgi:RimJ/RimL family protein N-acetyltransferase